MQAPAVLSDTPMENEEAVYPCKGCGEILEEGKAFELAGNRWHIDCFRCNTCGTLLDSDANLLLLGDGSLICNNCTYSCSACGNKIEDLAILTGDQAFCANCFKCRNCKRKIDNLRYARTSQGIFCMQCHESLMARRRKRGKGLPRTVSTNSTGSGPVVLDKSLPALPPHVLPTSAFPITSEANTPEAYEASEDQSPTSGRRDLSFPAQRELSPTTTEGRKENLILPPSTYSDGNSLLSSQNDNLTITADEDFFIPVTLDTDTVPPLLKNRRNNDQTASREPLGGTGKRTSMSAMKDDFQDLVAGSSRSGSQERNQARQRRSPLATSHIASQQRGRKSSADGTSATSPTTTELDRTRLSPGYEPMNPFDREAFRLQDAPKERPKRPTASRENSYRSFNTATSPSIEIAPQPAIPVDVDSGSTSPGYFETFESVEPKRKNSLRRARSPIPSGGLGAANPFDRPARDDSLLKTQKQPVTRKEVPRPEIEPTIDAIPSRHERKPSGSSTLGKQESKLVPSKSLGRPFAPSISSTLVDGPPARSPRRPASTKPEDDVDGASQIRAPSGQHGHRQTASVSSIQSEHFSSHDSILNAATEEGAQEGHESGGLFRKVSKAVRHGRSHSDKLNPVPSPKWMRNGSTDISSPIMPAPGSSEEIIQLRNKLRFTQQRVTELETEKMELQEKVNGTVDLRQMNVELRDKRTTMAFLDTQREMVIRELEVMTEHLAKVKDSNSPLDMDSLQAVVIRDFSSALQRLKDSLGTQIDELMRKKNDTTNQVTALMQMKDKAYQEYEALNTKNNQLSEVNSQLVQSIQETYKQNRQPGAPPPYANNTAPAQNGLGIYTNNNKDMDSKNPLTTTDSAMSQYSGETEVDSVNTLNAPKVVDIRKGQPPKKFNWKKGGQSVAKGVSKGFKGAFGGTQNSTLREEQFAEGVPYGSLQSGELPVSGNVPFNQSRAPLDPKQWGFLAAQKGGATKAGAWAQSSASSLAAADPSTLFGSDLSARCDYEKRLVPSIVSRCIEEVELRGIALEGIYRKSGSSSQVKTIQAGFEKDNLHYDISDPDLDIHAVTSTLKQYFRKLPNPLITFEAYDSLIEAMEGATTPGGRDADEERAMRVREVLDMLPRSHRETLEFLIEHLVRVMENESENLMTPLNIAVVFAPTIMRPHSIEREMTDMQSQRHAVQLMLEQSRICFGSDE